MALSFPNPTRAFDASRCRIRFWGHDGTFEVCFFVEQSALERLNPVAGRTEPEYLKTFDRFRDRIHSVATAVYRGSGRGTYSLAEALF